jgi:hypothetical protein
MLAARLINRRNPLRPIAAFASPCCRSSPAFLRTYSDGGPVIKRNKVGGTAIDAKLKAIADGLKDGTRKRNLRSDAGKPREPPKKKEISDPVAPIPDNLNGGTRKRRLRIDAGKPRGPPKTPPKPRTPSGKPRKKRKDAGTMKGPRRKDGTKFTERQLKDLKESFSHVLHGPRNLLSSLSPDGENTAVSKGPENSALGDQIPEDGTKRVGEEAEERNNLDLNKITHIKIGKGGDRARQNIVSSELCGMDVVFHSLELYS